MSTDTPQRTHDPDAGADAEGRPAERDRWRAAEDALDRRDDEDAPDRRDDELVVAVYPREVHEQVQPELDARRERRCREFEAEYADLLAERARLVEEVAALERQLDRAETRLDAVVEQYERLLAARDGSDAERLVGEDGDTGENSDADEDRDNEQVGRRREVDRRKADLAVRLRNWLR